MESLQNSLFEAAVKGCIDSLQQLLIYDRLVLERPFINRFNETPLHVAAMSGHIDFVKKIIEINPQLVHELNLQKHTPLHLAAAKGHVEVVKALLSVDDRLTCLARDRNGLTPVHLAVIKGRDEAVKLLLEAQPDAARMLVYEDEETILHLCIKNHQIEALKLIVATVNEAEFLNSKDVHGNTALHLAMADKQVETTEFLASMGAATMEVNAQDHDDVVLIQDSEIVESHAEGVVASKTNNNNNNNSSPNIASAHADLRQLHVDSKDTNSNSSSEETQRTSDGLMVAAVLLASMIFQIASNPPGGVWQEDNFLMDSQGHYVDPLGRRVSTPVDSHNNSVPYPRQAGHSVLARNDPVLYMIVCVCNGVGFSTSLAVILILMGGVPSNKLLLLAFYVISFFAFSAVSATYSYGVVAVTPKDIGLEIHQFALKLPFFCFVSLSAFFFVYGYWSSVKGNLKWLLVRMRTAVELVRNRVQALGRLEEVVEDVPQTKIETGIGTGIRMILRTSVASSAVV